jgi:TPR repeat protein
VAGLRASLRTAVAAAALLAAHTPMAAAARERAPDALVQEARAALAARDPLRARALMEEAAATGDPDALNNFATFVEMGVGGPPDGVLAHRLLEDAAERGSIAAKLNLGLRLTNSEQEADQRRAVELLIDVHNDPPDPAVIEKTRAIAAGGLGVAFLLGRGALQDVARGVDYLEEADAHADGDERTLFLLGRAYQRGWDVREPDPERALRYFQRAADLGHAESSWQVGMAHLRGAGVPASDALALDWFVRAAESGDPRGDVSAAYLLSRGRGTVEDDAEARRLYARAAEQGNPHALRGLGEMLLRGEGGARDEVQGLAYVMLAESAGVVESSGGEPLPAPSARTREKAERLAAEWRREHEAPGRGE